MKSTLMENSYDGILNLQGEKWEQGQIINGELQYKNKTNASLNLTPQLKIVYVDSKKFKNLENNSFKEIASINFDVHSLPPQGMHTFVWSYSLDNNAFITDKKHSLYLFWGDLSKKIPASLMLHITPHNSVQKIIDFLVTFFRFTQKDCISLSDHSIEFKLNPPVSKDFATMEHLKIQIKRVDQQLLLKAKSSLKILKADTSGMSVAKSEKTYDCLWEEKKYLLMPGHLDQDFLHKEFSLLISKVK